MTFSGKKITENRLLLTDSKETVISRIQRGKISSLEDLFKEYPCGDLEEILETLKKEASSKDEVRLRFLTDIFSAQGYSDAEKMAKEVVGGANVCEVINKRVSCTIKFSSRGNDYKTIESFRDDIETRSPKGAEMFCKDLKLLIGKEEFDLSPLFKLKKIEGDYYYSADEEAEGEETCEESSSEGISFLDATDDDGKKIRAALFFNHERPVTDQEANKAVKLWGIDPAKFEYCKYSTRGKKIIPGSPLPGDLGKWTPKKKK